MANIAELLAQYTHLQPPRSEKQESERAVAPTETQKRKSTKGKGITNKRQWVISQFQEAVNRERVGTKYKPMTGSRIAVMLSHIDTWTLEWFLSVCRDYKRRKGSFSKIFFGSLKVDKTVDKSLH